MEMGAVFQMQFRLIEDVLLSPLDLLELHLKNCSQSFACVAGVGQPDRLCFSFLVVHVTTRSGSNNAEDIATLRAMFIEIMESVRVGSSNLL